MKTLRDRKKLALLEEYGREEVHAFYQLTAFVHELPGAAFVIPDEDGDYLFSGITYELEWTERACSMSGGPAVRVLITPQASVGDVRRVLRKMRAMFKKDGFDGNVGDAEKALDAPVCPHCGNNPEEEPIKEEDITF